MQLFLGGGSVEGSWWRDQSDLDDEQVKFIDLPQDGRYLLIGPPGSGKTNLLLLRAKYYYGQGLKNILVITFTKDLANFIRTGIGAKGYLPPEVVMTYHSWAARHVRDHLGPGSMGSGKEFSVESRDLLVDLVAKATEASVTKKMYDMILVDEAQDLSKEELTLLLALSDRVALAGDRKQGIYEQDGLTALTSLGLKTVALKYHYRIGPEICKVADKIIPPENADELLEKYCNYKEVDYGSSATLDTYANLDAQYGELLDSVVNQLKAYPNDSIGIITPKNELIVELRNRFSTSVLANDIAYHDLDSEDHAFTSGKRIHVLTAHSAKGTEFRAVHIFATEKFKFPLHHRELLYTAVTRAKTSLSAYRTGSVLGYIETAFAKPQHTKIADLF